MQLRAGDMVLNQRIGLFADPPPPPPPAYDKVMTAILQELKFLHMQSASQGELHIACKALPEWQSSDGLPIVQAFSLATQSEKSLPTERRKQFE